MQKCTEQITNIKEGNYYSFVTRVSRSIYIHTMNYLGTKQTVTKSRRKSLLIILLVQQICTCKDLPSRHRLSLN